LLLEHLNTNRSLILGQMLDCFEQCEIFLANDLVKLSGLHPRLLQLLEGLPSIDTLMLAGVSNEQNFVLRADLLEELPHLLGGRQRRFINHVQVLLSWIAIPASGKETLQSIGGYANVAELLRGTGGWSKTLH
jgi:hypothetical protein